MNTYKLKDGERAVLIFRDGRKIHNGYMHRKCVSIAITTPDLKKVYFPKGDGHSPYVFGSTGEFAYHYKSGFSRRDAVLYRTQIKELNERAITINTWRTARFSR